MSKGATFLTSFIITLLLSLGLIYIATTSSEEETVIAVTQEEFKVQDGVDLTELEPSN